MAYAIKAEVVDPRATTFTFTAHKTMYGGKLIAEGDTVFVFASENEGGQGLIARGIWTCPVYADLRIDGAGPGARPKRLGARGSAGAHTESFGAYEGFAIQPWYQDVQTGAGRDALLLRPRLANALSRPHPPLS